MRRHRKRARPKLKLKGVAAEVTDSILDAIQRSPSPWQMPWHTGADRTLQLPRSIAGRRYSGINVLSLWASARRFGFSDPTWATEECWRKAGMRLLPAENATTAIIYRERKTSATTGPIRFARRLPLYNRHQVYGDQAKNDPRPKAILIAIDELAQAAGARIEIGSTGACYRPEHDDILLPHHARFRGSLDRTSEAFAAVLLHELVHWSGAPHRLNRDLTGRFGSSAYAMEELVAELGCAFLCAELGIASRPRPDHARYISGWLRVLKNDNRAILVAASQAEKATRYLLRFRRLARQALKASSLKEPVRRV